jgi:hypothetical protein
MPSARLEEAENTGCLEMNRVDMDCRPVPQRPAEVLNAYPRTRNASPTNCAIIVVRESLRLHRAEA